MKLHILLSIISVSLQTTMVIAWTQYQHFGHRLLNTVLRLREQDDVEVERTRLEDFWDVDDQQDFFPLFNNNYDQIKSLPVGEWAEGLLADNEWNDVCYGDECDVSGTSGS